MASGLIDLDNAASLVVLGETDDSIQEQKTNDDTKVHPIF